MSSTPSKVLQGVKQAHNANLSAQHVANANGGLILVLCISNRMSPLKNRAGQKQLCSFSHEVTKFSLLYPLAFKNKLRHIFVIVYCMCVCLSMCSDVFDFMSVCMFLLCE